MKTARTASYTPEEDLLLLVAYPVTDPQDRDKILPGRTRISIEWRYRRINRTSSDRARRGMAATVEPRHAPVSDGPYVAPIKVASIFALGAQVAREFGVTA